MDSVLNRLYLSVLKDHQDDRRFTDALRTAERAWITYRDASLDAIIPLPTHAMPSAQEQARWEYYSPLTRRHIEELYLWYIGQPLNSREFGYANDKGICSYRT